MSPPRQAFNLLDKPTVSEVDPVELTGGTINRPVRIGDTVHRASGPWSENVRDLLTHLQGVGFDYAPRFLGFDEEGREVLSYIPGQALMRPWPSAFRELGALRDVARVVRLYHDAVADYRPPTDRPWFNGRTDPLPGEIIIHGDLGPWNIIIDDAGEVTGIIDWDFAQPGNGTTDIAYLAFYLTMLRDDEAAASAGFTSPPDRRARLEALATAYGADPISVASEAYRIEFDRRCRIRALGPTGQEPWAGFLVLQG
jgi:hypothetical protein